MSHLDQTLLLSLKGYAWLPDLRRRANGRPVPLRVLGQRAVAIGGPDAARFFYTEGNVERSSAGTGTSAGTSAGTGTGTGTGTGHTLDGPAHRHRKALFTSLLTDANVPELADLAGEEFDSAARRWRGQSEISLLDETARVLTAAVLRWTGVPETQRDRDDLLAMIDGSATLGPRHERALAARRRQERWLAEIIEDVRREPRARSPLTTIALHSEDGNRLDSRTAAAGLLDIICSATAVTWLVTFAAHALDRWPNQRERLRDGGDEYAQAFAHEVRRFYPSTPFLAGRASRDLRFQGAEIPAGRLVLLDVYGPHHDERVWPAPYEFRPERFLGRPVGEFELIPPVGGDRGEQLLSTLVKRLAGLDYYLPPQRTGIDLSRIPARPRDGIRIVVPAETPVAAGRH